MKRGLSLLVSLVLVVSLVPSALAASSAPYSLPYVESISGVEYKKYSAAENLVAEDYTVSQRTLEMYDVFDLWFAQDTSWSATVQFFRNAFISAGFSESVALDKYGQEEYTYTLKNSSSNSVEMFVIMGETAAHNVLNESALVFIEHAYITPQSEQDSPTQTPTPSTPPETNSEATAQQAAQALYDLGLFGGVGTDSNGNLNFDLDRVPTRHEAVTMLVRLLGKENEAKAGNWITPFTDVADWAKSYVGYAYVNGLASGTSATTFAGEQNVSASQYLTFVLRALGYDSDTDFQWDKAWELSDKIGLTNGQYNASTTNFTRGDMAIISNKALGVQNKEGTATLKDMLHTPPTSTPTPPTTPSQPQTPVMGSIDVEVLCKPGKTARVRLENATAVEWKSCCGDVIIVQSDKSSCDIYVLSTASTRKHHHIECTDSNGYKYICMVELL